MLPRSRAGDCLELIPEVVCRLLSNSFHVDFVAKGEIELHYTRIRQHFRHEMIEVLLAEWAQHEPRGMQCRSHVTILHALA
jgi:hypothetical protein